MRVCGSDGCQVVVLVWTNKHASHALDFMHTCVCVCYLYCVESTLANMNQRHVQEGIGAYIADLRLL